MNSSACLHFLFLFLHTWSLFPTRCLSVSLEAVLFVCVLRCSLQFHPAAAQPKSVLLCTINTGVLNCTKPYQSTTLSNISEHCPSAEKYSFDKIICSSLKSHFQKGAVAVDCILPTQCTFYCHPFYCHLSVSFQTFFKSRILQTFLSLSMAKAPYQDIFQSEYFSP